VILPRAEDGYERPGADFGGRSLLEFDGFDSLSLSAAILAAVILGSLPYRCVAKTHVAADPQARVRLPLFRRVEG
jgi:hypothetical protein